MHLNKLLICNDPPPTLTSPLFPQRPPYKLTPHLVKEEVAGVVVADEEIVESFVALVFVHEKTYGFFVESKLEGLWAAVSSLFDEDVVGQGVVGAVEDPAQVVVGKVLTVPFVEFLHDLGERCQGIGAGGAGAAFAGVGQVGGFLAVVQADVAFGDEVGLVLDQVDFAGQVDFAAGGVARQDSQQVARVDVVFFQFDIDKDADLGDEFIQAQEGAHRAFELLAFLLQRFGLAVAKGLNVAVHGGLDESVQAALVALGQLGLEEQGGKGVHVLFVDEAVFLDGFLLGVDVVGVGDLLDAGGYVIGLEGVVDGLAVVDEVDHAGVFLAGVGTVEAGQGLHGLDAA